MADKDRVVAGAQVLELGLQNQLTAWARHHRDTARKTLRELYSNWITTLMTTLVIGIALSLPGIMYLIVSNLMSVSAEWQGRPSLSIYYDEATSLNEQAQILRQWPEINSVEIISPAAALAEFEAISGFKDVLSSLDSNPLPGVLVIVPDASDPVEIRLLTTRLGKMPAVSSVTSDIAWIERLHAMLTIGQRLVLAMSIVLALGVCLIVGNTIRLAIESRRSEIEVVKLVGGTNAFVRRPFLYQGCWFGLVGGILAWLLIQFSLGYLSGPVAQLASSYNSEFAMTGLGLTGSLLLMFGVKPVCLSGRKPFYLRISLSARWD